MIASLEFKSSISYISKIDKSMSTATFNTETRNRWVHVNVTSSKKKKKTYDVHDTTGLIIIKDRIKSAGIKT